MKSLHWDITRKCNLRCKHCYNADKYFNEESGEYCENELSLEEARKVVEFAVKNSFQRIHLLGGEPLASPCVFEVIELAKKNGLLVTMNSNAVLLDDDAQNRLINLEIDHFAASLDGATIYTNDFVRGEGSFNVACKNLINFNQKIIVRKSPIQTALAFSISKLNYHEVSYLPALTERLGCSLLAVSLFVECGNGEKNKEYFDCAVSDQFDVLEKMVREELWKHDVYLQIDSRPIIADYLRTKYGAKVIFNIYNSLCCAGEDIWYLEADGRVHPCLVYRTVEGKEAVKEGIIQPENIFLNQKSSEEIVQTNYWKQFQQYKKQFDKSRISICENCAYLELCMPCPYKYGGYDKEVDECEWVWRKIRKDYMTYEQKCIRRVDDVSISDGILSIGRKSVLKINEMSANMIYALFEQGTIDKALEVMLETYQVDRKKVFIDMMFLLYNLLSVRAVHLMDAND